MNQTCGNPWKSKLHLCEATRQLSAVVSLEVLERQSLLLLRIAIPPIVSCHSKQQITEFIFHASLVYNYIILHQSTVIHTILDPQSSHSAFTLSRLPQRPPPVDSWRTLKGAWHRPVAPEGFQVSASH